MADTERTCNLFLVIEHADDAPSKAKIDFRRRANSPRGADPLDMLLKEYITAVTVVPILADGWQWYTARRLHTRPHFTLTRVSKHVTLHTLLLH